MITLLDQDWVDYNMDHKLSLFVEYQTLESPSSLRNTCCKILDHNNGNDAENIAKTFCVSYINEIVHFKLWTVPNTWWRSDTKPTCRVNVPNLTQQLWQKYPSTQSGAWTRRKGLITTLKFLQWKDFSFQIRAQHNRTWSAYVTRRHVNLSFVLIENCDLLKSIISTTSPLLFLESTSITIITREIDSISCYPI